MTVAEAVEQHWIAKGSSQAMRDIDILYNATPFSRGSKDFRITVARASRKPVRRRAGANMRFRSWTCKELKIPELRVSACGEAWVRFVYLRACAFLSGLESSQVWQGGEESDWEADR
jgi:hypothetical protein